MFYNQGCFGTPRGGPTVSSWMPFPLSVGAVTTAPGLATTQIYNVCKARKNGENLEITINYKHTSATGATPGSGVYLFKIPFGLTADTNHVPLIDGNGVGGAVLSTVSHQSTSYAAALGYCTLNTATQFQIIMTGNASTSLAALGSATSGWDNGTFVLSLYASIPIVQFKST